MILEKNDKNIENAIRLCFTNKEMYCGIYCATLSELRQVQDYLFAHTQGINEHIVSCKQSHGHMNMMFDNGSGICVCLANDTARGRRNHLILVSPYVDKETMNSIVIPSHWTYKETYYDR